MGQAKRRGTYEERYRQAIDKWLAAHPVDKQPEHLKKFEQRLRNRSVMRVAAIAMLATGSMFSQ